MARLEVDPMPDVISRRRRRPGKRGWVLAAALGLVVAAAISLTAFALHFSQAQPLAAAGAIGWLDEQDAAAAVQTQADLHSQSTVPIRPGQRQGFFVEIVNPSNVTQTVIGLSGDFVFFVDGEDRLAVSTRSPVEAGVDERHQTYADSGTLPPGAERVLRVTWTTPLECRHSKGTTLIVDSLPIRVRVGGFTRTEHLKLNQAMALTATQSC